LTLFLRWYTCSRVYRDDHLKDNRLMGVRSTKFQFNISDVPNQGSTKFILLIFLWCNI